MLCSTAQGKRKCHSSVLLCKTGSQHALCHCNYIYGHLLIIKVCCDPAAMLFSTARVKENPHCSVLLCRTGSQHALCHCIHPYEDLLCIQVCSDHNSNDLQHCSGQKRIPTVLCCSAKQAHSMHCVTAITSTDICFSYKCAVTQQQCYAALFRA